jgi:hypothetical protein
MIRVAGATLVAGYSDGLYWLMPAILFAPVGGVAEVLLFRFDPLLG